MLGLPIRHVLEPRKLVVVAPEASVREAARLMSENRVMALGLDPDTTRIDEVMTPGPRTVTPDESFGLPRLSRASSGRRRRSAPGR